MELHDAQTAQWSAVLPNILSRPLFYFSFIAAWVQCFIYLIFNCSQVHLIFGICDVSCTDPQTA
jgi:hypothetical protein